MFGTSFRKTTRPDGCPAGSIGSLVPPSITTLASTIRHSSLPFTYPHVYLHRPPDDMLASTQTRGRAHAAVARGVAPMQRSRRCVRVMATAQPSSLVKVSQQRRVLALALPSQRFCASPTTHLVEICMFHTCLCLIVGLLSYSGTRALHPHVCLVVPVQPQHTWSPMPRAAVASRPLSRRPPHPWAWTPPRASSASIPSPSNGGRAPR